LKYFITGLMYIHIWFLINFNTVLKKIERFKRIPLCKRPILITCYLLHLSLKRSIIVKGRNDLNNLVDLDI